MKSLMEELLFQLESGRDVALVKITGSAGSTPRGTGARMLVGEEGRLAGTIGGDMVEFKATSLALDAIKEKKSSAHHYTLRPNEAEDLGMICGGDIDIDISYFDCNEAAIAMVKKEIENENEKMEWGRAIIFGGGHIGQELAPLLAHIHFKTIIFDDRAEYANPALFPKTCQTICGAYDEIDKHITLSDNDYIVVVTRGHAADFESVLFACQRPFAYCGCIGSKIKSAALRERLCKAGVPEETIQKVHMPIGLNIGGRTPEEIAISIAAEMIQTRAALTPHA